MQEDHIANELGGSTPAYDPRFAQAREAIHHETPAKLAVIREERRLAAGIEELQARLAAAESAGAPEETLARLESRLSAAVDRYAELVDEDGDGEQPGEAIPGYVSLQAMLASDLDTGEMLADEVRQIRLDTFRALNRFAFQDGVANPWLAWKNWLAVVRRTNPEYLEAGGMSKADLAVLLGETRAATSDREIRILEKYLRRWGVKGFQLLGGNKSMETRERCRKSALGNTSRRTGMNKK